MKKLIWSAFAMSLVLNLPSSFAQKADVEDFWGMESEILPALQGSQKFSPRDLHQMTSWNVQEKEVEIDSAEPLKGQSYSLTAWSTQDPDAWMDIDKWMLERSLKDKAPDWKFRLRDDRHLEHVGKVLQCKGTCDVYRGIMKAKVQHLSRINEGDELKTGPDSTAWIYLMDGTLARIGPSSAVTFQEINWSKDEVFHLVRIHQGHIFWHPREKMDYPMELGAETDAFSLPLMVREANQAYFEREIFSGQNDTLRSQETVRLEETAVTLQIRKLNHLKAENNKLLPPVTRVMMVAPNATLIGSKTSFDLFHYPGGKSHFKKRLSQEGHDLKLHMRGYIASEPVQVSEEAWFEVATNGKTSQKVEAVTGALEITELITRRIKTLELAREFWLQKYTLDVVKNLNDSKKLAVEQGYTLWGESLNKRFDFLVEYTRRMETTNLRSMENLLNKLEAAGETSQKEMSDSHYVAALNYYLRDLKTRYISQRMQVREMNDLQYYIWILRHGKKTN